MSDNPVVTIDGHDVPRSVIDKALNDTAAEVKQLVPSTPSPALLSIVTMVVRWGIGMWGMHETTVAQNVTGSEIETMAGIVAIIIAFCWGLLSKKWASWREDQTAKASASASAAATIQSGVATAVPVQPSATTSTI